MRPGTASRATGLWCVPIVFCVPLLGCFAVSSYQSARLAPPGQVASTIAVGRASFEDSDDGWTAIDLGARRRLGRMPSDWGLKFTVLHASGGGLTAGGSLDSKVSLLRDHLALQVPFTWIAGDTELETAHVHPGLIGSIRLAKSAEINAHGQLYWFMKDVEGAGRSLTVGLAMGADLDRWAIRPELTWYQWPRDRSGERETFHQWGIGLEMRTRPEADADRKPPRHPTFPGGG